MEHTPALSQFLGSLAAIMALTAIVWWLRLGPEPRLTGPDQARMAADEVVSGFDPVAIGLDVEGRGALLRDAQGRVMVLRPHGAHFAGRLLTPATDVRRDGPVLTIDPGERRFGAAQLVLEDAEAWRQAIEAIRAA